MSNKECEINETQCIAAVMNFLNICRIAAGIAAGIAAPTEDLFQSQHSLCDEDFHIPISRQSCCWNIMFNWLCAHGIASIATLLLCGHGKARIATLLLCGHVVAGWSP